MNDNKKQLLETGAVYHGFKVIDYSYIEEVSSNAYIMEHEQSGARLLYLGNEDDNKVFSISFRTPASDDTGVAHIMEHSTLCGSRKYHLKEPFVELVKGSLNTFLNAMTYPDKTMYPVASRNDKDFRNLMDVYLDAVFYPLIYENKYTLRQEGWHYDIDSPEGELSYNGVVYNEMKGVYSSPDSYLEREALMALFPNTTYHYESGGYPEAIPQLTQEKFEAFHKSYYSPENSYIYLYGDMDIDDTLKYLNDDYLSSFHKTGTVHSEIEEQQPLERTAEVTATYPVDAGEDCAGKTYLELSIVTGKSTDVLTSEALALLQNVLLSSEAAPLRRALLEAGVGSNISGSYERSMLQPVFSIRASGSEPELRDKFVNVIYKTLQDITINGLDKKLLEATLNAAEFKLRECDYGAYPKGLIFGLNVMHTWLYGGDPRDALTYLDGLAKLREGINNGFYERIIEQYLLDNTHRCLVTLVPEPGKEEKDKEVERERMAALKATMSTEELQQYADECVELHRRQAAPDSEEALASIPILKREDIRRKCTHLEYTEEEWQGNKLIFLPQHTNEIVYTNWYFDTTGIPARLLPACFLLTDVLGKFDTASYTYQELTTLGIMYTGGVSFDFRSAVLNDDANDYKVYFTLKGKALLHNLPKFFEIISSMALESKLEDKKRLQDLIAELKTDWDDDFFVKGQNVAVSRLNSYSSSAARVNEQDWLSYYQYIKDLAANFEEKWEQIFADLHEALTYFFQKSRFLLFYSCDEELQAEVRQQCLDFAAKLPVNEAVKNEPEKLPALEPNEGITTSGKVQYVVAGGNFKDYGHEFHGSMTVLETILRYEYLWTKIRVQGGAYGANAIFTRNGLMAFTSYRDPQLEQSLAAYEQLADWLEQAEFTPRELDKYVIGTMSTADTPMTNYMRLNNLGAWYIKGITEEMRQQTRNQVLDVTAEDLHKLAPVIRDVMEHRKICVVGGKQIIEASSDKFNNIINM